MLTYVMTAAQSAAWQRGDTAQVQAQIAHIIYRSGCHEDVVVALPDGQIAYHLCLCWGALTSAND
jgi:hypothetical protein